MSRPTTPQTQTQPAPHGNTIKVAHDKIAMRAYEKWCKRGQPIGNPEQDWMDAERELMQEVGRGQATQQARR
ncbi:hypothetical protein AYO44_02305 [Planctomycetaceae bacterium SCGC AG-212-F19]|nr:hypothetical protein AYO44_02305 [Planctomycetaceae bacterium SCGC AG-212-F19]